MYLVFNVRILYTLIEFLFNYFNHYTSIENYLAFEMHVPYRRSQDKK